MLNNIMNFFQIFMEVNFPEQETPLDSITWILSRRLQSLEHFGRLSR
jgi:hypothetical protein